MAIEDLFTNLFTVKSFAGTDEYGKDNDKIDGDSGNCRLVPTTGIVVVDSNGEDVLIDGRVYLLPEVTIDEKDDIDIDGIIYRIIKLRRHTDSAVSHHIRIDIRKD